MLLNTEADRTILHLPLEYASSVFKMYLMNSNCENKIEEKVNAINYGLQLKLNSNELKTFNIFTPKRIRKVLKIIKEKIDTYGKYSY